MIITAEIVRREGGVRGKRQTEREPTSPALDTVAMSPPALTVRQIKSEFNLRLTAGDTVLLPTQYAIKCVNRM